MGLSQLAIYGIMGINLLYITRSKRKMSCTKSVEPGQKSEETVR
jgi:Trk-type K+ transport system membrane component